MSKSRKERSKKYLKFKFKLVRFESETGNMEIYFPHLMNGKPKSCGNEGPFTHNGLRLAADKIALGPTAMVILIITLRIIFKRWFIGIFALLRPKPNQNTRSALRHQ